MKKIVGRKSCGNVHVDLANTADLIRELNYRGYHVFKHTDLEDGNIYEDDIEPNKLKKINDLREKIKKEYYGEE